MLQLIKRALIRDPSVPVGQPAPMHVNCGCGEAVLITSSSNECHRCGDTYDHGGWLLAGPSLKQKG